MNTVFVLTIKDIVFIVVVGFLVLFFIYLRIAIYFDKKRSDKKRRNSCSDGKKV